jgi:hypothetical protein
MVGIHAMGNEAIQTVNDFKIFETDWLASKPVFYNTKTGIASRNINDVIDYHNLEIHPEGFNNYLDFGYSVFGQTPVRHVKFLRHSSRLTVDGAGKILVENFDDPAERYHGRIALESDIWNRLEANVQRWEEGIEGDIIIPTSGGFDSRLLNFFISDKNRICSFTYGVSEPPSDSYEVVHAKELSRILGTHWEMIELGEFHRYLYLWDRMYGVSTHAHGMYQIEFFTKVRNRAPLAKALLSGIVGDAWAGSKDLLRVNRPDKLVNIGLAHGMAADSEFSQFRPDGLDRQRFFEMNKGRFSDPFWLTLTAVRLKMILLSYLLRVPEEMKFQPWSPFLDIDLALSMLSLPEARRRRRTWQIEFLEKKGIHIEKIPLRKSMSNTLNKQAYIRLPVPMLDADILGEVVRRDYVEWINKTLLLKKRNRIIFDKALEIPKIGGVIRRLGLGKDPFTRAYCAFLTLKPIENLLRRRNLDSGAEGTIGQESDQCQV